MSKLKKSRPSFWRADRFRFEVEGPHAQKFLSGAARQDARLYRVRCTANGYSATALGRDRAALQALAERGGWRWTVLGRRGPGRLVERGALRLGVPCGIVLFLLLVRFFQGFIWAIDFGTLDLDRQPALRTLLAENNICEGLRPTEDELRRAQQALVLQSGEFGWLSLNFAGGCLYLESTTAEKQEITPPAENTALYASEDAEVLAIEVESGFAEAAPGQIVARGQLLAAAAKRDRGGSPVSQAATGRVIGRVIKSYTAEQPLETELTALTGARFTADTLYLLGGAYAAEDGTCPYAAFDVREDWLPLTLGRLALPAGICRRTYWETAALPITYTREAANALAARNCYLQLAAEHPDAVVEEKQTELTEQASTSVCRMTIIFTADIASREQNHTELPPPQQE